MKKCIMHDGGKQMREKAVSRSREHSKDVALCGLFAALVAVGAFIKVVIPTGADTMNFTLQWFFVMLAAFLLGSRRAFTSVGVYLLIGLAGVPIFARGGGPAYLLRPTFGFLLGFLLAAWVMGKVCECLNSWKMGALMTAATAGYVVYYGMGMVYFYLITHLVTLAADRLESDCAGLLPAGDAGGLYSLHSGGDHGKTAAPDGTGVSVERNE